MTSSTTPPPFPSEEEVAGLRLAVLEAGIKMISGHKDLVEVSGALIGLLELREPELGLKLGVEIEATYQQLMELYRLLMSSWSCIACS